MSSSHGHRFLVVCSALALCSAYRIHGHRIGVNLEAEDTAGSGCYVAKDCGSCLSQTPFVYGGAYCKWCPARYWVGATKDAGALGSCRHATSSDHECEQWSLPGVTPLSYNREPRRLDLEDAALFCPSEEPEDEGVVDIGKRLGSQTAASLAAMDFNNASGLRLILTELNTEIQRMNRFRFTNPPLFNAKFHDTSSAKVAGAYAWKSLVWGVNFVPVVGNSISLLVGGITDVVESTMISAQGRSQDKLVSQGRDADSQYFSDVTFGLINDAYTSLLSMNSTEVRDMIQGTLGDRLAQQTGVALDTFNEFNAKKRVKAAKFAGHAGLFVGGFFTMGATWVAGCAWTAAELATTAATTAAGKKALATKTRMLTGLARLMDESVWAEDTDRCDITDWALGKNPCPTSVEDGKQIKRVCTRTSPWGLHKSKIEKGLFSPEGRCYPTNQKLLSEGLPCLTHDSCHSSYCHFETRMQYFLSDHARVYHKRKSGKVPIPDQLHAMQAQEELLPNENTLRSNYSSVQPLEDFVGEYNSYEGVKYATTGTCAKACPASSIGHGECGAITLRDTARDVHAADTHAVAYDFGILIPNRLMMGYSTQGYNLVGKGACADRDGLLVVEDTLFLTTMGEAAVKECAQHCWDRACPSFQTLDLGGKFMCNMHSAVAGTVVPETSEDFDSRCYATLHNWPLDIYQPWNAVWYLYISDVNRVIAKLTKKGSDNAFRRATRITMVLDKIKLAYANFCSDSSDSFSCPDPADWDVNDAINMLTVMAPLSATQLRTLREQIDPGRHEIAFRGAEKVALRDLFADKEWGEAWRRFLGAQNVEEVKTEDAEEAATLKADFAQKLQNIAAGSNLRMEDGVWDLQAAQTEQMKALDVLSKFNTVPSDGT